MPRVKWENYNKYTAEEGDVLEGFSCLDCGLLDPVSFKKCPNCKGAFYDLFRHTYQSRAFHHCWACLEAGSNREVHFFYKKFSQIPPPDRLIPPVVTAESLKAGDDAFWNELDSTLH